MKSARGFALFTALILLGILALVGVFALRSSGLELQMSTNTILRTEAFEASEGPRLLTGEVVDAHVFSRGWPKTIDDQSTISDGEFDYGPLLDWVKSGWYQFIAGSNGRPRQWYLGNDESYCGATCVLDETDLVTDALYQRDLVPDGQSSSAPIKIENSLAVFKVRTDLAPGAGAAMVAGYEGTGKAAAARGGNIFFYLSSRGRDTTQLDDKAEASTETAAMYRHVIRN